MVLGPSLFQFFISFGTSSTMTAELEGSLPSRSNILSKFVHTLLVLMNSPSALVLIYDNVGLWHKVKLDPLYPWMRPCEIGQDKVI